MVAISTSQAESSIFFLDLPAVTLKEKKIREERTIIYNAFLNTLKNLEKDTHQYIQKIQEKLLDPQIEGADYDAYKELLDKQKELLARLQSEEEKKIFNFLLANHKNIFKVDQKKIKELNKLNEENFSRLLVLVYKKIRAEGLADKKNLKNGEIKKVSGKLADEKSLEGDEIKEVVDDSIGAARGTEAWDWFFNGIKNNMPGVSLLRKIPGFEKILGKEEEKKNKKQLNEEEVVTKFLRKSLWPIITLIIVISLGGLSGPMSVFGLFTIPYPIVIGSAVFGFVAAEYKAVKVLFSNDEECTSDGPDKSFSSHDKDVVNVKVQEQVQQKQKEDKEQAEEYGEKFSKDISDIILNTPVQGAKKSVQNGSKFEEVIVTHPAPTDPASTKWRRSEGERKEAGETLFRS
ncbi:hypothetical protein [Wolbachia endosymbiont (group E) of Neria commutata]|uniref:hypothetical protein n=1 Tax=Wolbachia endosymbiont (group E) of Neria commutata TaxID=3066149 RepID=UPI003132E34B